ncbi:peptidoglycan DD-metalloendopeptidase family protein [Sphingosinicella sp. YJ22]|uniref:murein hydrolase activator EnvC family protein n=1 Tax=Sphingosinicella sp. YJ22 TaxID=1104780 RepID=UPI00140A79B0|nr:peptidoglycan DD-metalloendopeptidase family protein [Sphingosinicella sp. YJ22]
MRAGIAILALSLTGGSLAVAAPRVDPASFRAAINEAREAQQRADQLERQAAEATDDAARARAEAESLVARIEAAEAEITAAEGRSAFIAAQLRIQRARLAERQGPLIRLTAALQNLSRRPPALALVQPGSLDDAMRVRAVLAAALPQIRARTAGLRAEIDRANALLAQEEMARQALVASRSELGARRTALAELEARQRARSEGLADLALRESDRALALGEEARGLEEVVRDRAFQRRLATRLAELDGPAPRPGGNAAAAARGNFLLPVRGRVLTGTGELSEAGVHARGLTLEVEPQAVVRAPSNGRVAFSGPFRSYGSVVILDHGGGWTSLVTNLAGIGVSPGQRVQRGAVVGRARGGGEPVTIELRHNGRPVPVTAALAG